MGGEDLQFTKKRKATQSIAFPFLFFTYVSSIL